MDNNRGGPQATAEEHEIELMKQQLVPSMSEDIEKALRRLNVSAGGEACTIFRVPEAIGGGIAKAVPASHRLYWPVPSWRISVGNASGAQVEIPPHHVGPNSTAWYPP